MSYKEKDQKKFEICTHVFGYGVEGSTSAKYHSDYKSIHSDCVVGISVNGARPNRYPLTKEWVQRFTRLKCAIVADSTYHRERAYNVGERELAKYLKELDYVCGVSDSKRSIWYHKSDYDNFTNPKPTKAKFRGNYYFLSNMFPCLIYVDGYEFLSVEAAYQAAKDPSNVTKYQDINGYQAKRIAVKPSQEFHNTKLGIMKFLLEIKFSNPSLMNMLVQVPDEDLVEVNTWGDKYWGTCNGVGENHLGNLLKLIKHKHLNIPLSTVLESYELWD